ncbi:EAL domain-containing protein [Klebsiella pneumoniae]|uniref:EAL domain-containing protein n=1 Tax=Klebsiella pneumoniae TaxID=573 RepID=UPI0036F216B6
MGNLCHCGADSGVLQLPSRSAFNSALRTLSLGIVAEGVENNEQFELLKNMNCDEFQGYYYSKPLSGDQLIDFLRGQKK